MCLFTADGFTGELIECNEGDLQWMDKKKCLRFRPGKEMPFFKTADRGRRAPLFTLRLVYEGSKLVENNCTGIHRKQIKFEIISAQRLLCKQYLRNLI